MSQDILKGVTETEILELAKAAINNDNGSDPLACALSVFDGLQEGSPLIEIENALRILGPSLNGSDPLRRATLREAILKRLEPFGLSSPAKLVDAALGNGGGEVIDQQGKPVLFENIEPWLEVVNGADLLDDFVSALKRHVVLPQWSAEATALWILHAHALEAFTISPLLVATSPTKRSGKTLLLEIVSLAIPRRLFASNITPSALFRAVDKFKPTLLIDEADTFLKENEELRGIINASHRRASAFVLRSVGDEHEPAIFSTWSAKAIALIGKLKDTLEDRSIIISLRRKNPTEKVERFRIDKVTPGFTILRRKAARWAADNLTALREADPKMPDALNDRAADNWRPLLAIADLAGGNWPKLAQEAALALSGNVDEGENSALIQLLADLEELFKNVERLSSAEIVKELGAMEDRPWSEWRKGKPITPRQLARLLAPLGIAPKSVRLGEKDIPRGYAREQLDDSFIRYLSATTPQDESTIDNIKGNGVKTDPPHNFPVVDRKAGLSAGNIKDVADVADRNPLLLKMGEVWRDDL